MAKCTFNEWIKHLTSLIRGSVVGLSRHLQLHLTNFPGVQPCLLLFSITNIQTQYSLLHGHDIATPPPQCLKPFSKNGFRLGEFPQ